MNMSETSGGRG